MVHTFPADGDYVFRLDFFAEPLGILFGNTASRRADRGVDRRRAGGAVRHQPADERVDHRAVAEDRERRTSPAGPHRLTAAFLQRFEGPVNDLVAPIEHTLADTEIGIAVGITTLPHLRNLAVVGPHRVTGVSETASRRRIFTCRPTTAADEAACATAIVRGLATTAFRRPPTDKEVARLMRFYDDGRQGRNFEAGVGQGGRGDSGQPAVPVPAGGHAAGGASRASRTGSPRWNWPRGCRSSSGAAGRTRRWSTPRPAPGCSGVSLEKQVGRMLADPRAEALATRFAAQWLRLQDLDDVSPDPILYPYYDRTLAQALQRETELFFASLVREDRSILDLLTADYTYVNDRVARHYGIPGVSRPAVPAGRPARVRGAASSATAAC